MKEHIDIEKLLEWAYRQQCADRVAATRFTPRGPSGDANSAAVMMMQLGCRVDTSSHAERVLGAQAPDDALVVHDTVLALGEMWIDERCGVWTLASVEAIGMVITRHSGSWWLAHTAGGQGAPLTQACTAALVIQHAKAGSRPEWCAGWQDKGAAVARDPAERDARGRKRKGYAGLGREEVAYYRATYAVWHAALLALADALAGALTEYEVTAPRASPEPWLEQGETGIQFQRLNVA